MIDVEREQAIMDRVNSGETSLDWLSQAIMFWATLMHVKEEEDDARKNPVDRT